MRAYFSNIVSNISTSTFSFSSCFLSRNLWFKVSFIDTSCYKTCWEHNYVEIIITRFKKKKKKFDLKLLKTFGSRLWGFIRVKVNHDYIIIILIIFIWLLYWTIRNDKRKPISDILFIFTLILLISLIQNTTNVYLLF